MHLRTETPFMSNPSRDSVTSEQQQQQQQPTLQSNASQQPNRKTQLIVRRLIILLVSLFVIMSVVGWIAWFIIHPLNPIFTVKSFSVSNFTLSDNSRILKADYDIVVSIKNPNKKVGLLIDHFDIRMLYKDTNIAKAWTEGVYLEKMSQQNRSPRFSKNFNHPFHRREFDEIRNDYWGKREVSFNVRIMIRTRFRYGNWLTKKRVIKSSCMNLVVDFSAKKENMGKLKVGEKDCLFY